jgi:hypothetical protein
MRCGVPDPKNQVRCGSIVLVLVLVVVLEEWIETPE